jgi:hypothetical protein
MRSDQIAGILYRRYQGHSGDEEVSCTFEAIAGILEKVQLIRGDPIRVSSSSADPPAILGPLSAEEMIALPVRFVRTRIDPPNLGVRNMMGSPD